MYLEYHEFYICQIYISADFSGFFKNLEKWERIINRLNKRFCYQDRGTYKKVLPPPPQEPRCYKKEKNIRNIMGTIFLTVICPAIHHLENVYEKVSHID